MKYNIFASLQHFVQRLVLYYTKLNIVNTSHTCHVSVFYSSQR